jgi:hypothetical protein
MILVLAALTGTAFGTGVIVGLALGASSSPVPMHIERLVGSGAKKGPRRPGRTEP